MKFYLSFFLALCVSAEAATYYVRKDGNNKNAGTGDHAGGAWLTIGKAASVVKPGDTVYVRQGLYQEYVTLTRPGTRGSRITWHGERNAAGDWLTILDASQAVNSGWVRATEVDPKGNGVYKHTSLPFRPGAIVAGNKFVPEFMREGRDPVRTDGGVALSPGGQTPLNASASTLRVDDSYSGPYWDGLEACWHWQTNTATAYLRFKNGANPNTAGVRIADNGGASESAVNRAPLWIRASWNTWDGFHVRNAGTVIAINPAAWTDVEGVAVVGNKVTGSANPIQLRRDQVSSSVSSNAILNNVVSSSLFAGETGGAWSLGSSSSWPKYHTYLWNKNQGTSGGSDYAAITLSECGNSNRVSGNIINGLTEGIRVLNYSVFGSFTTISSNTISRVSGAGVYIAFGNAYDLIRIHDNVIQDAQAHFRHQSIRRNTPINRGTARVYLYRNRGWNPSHGSWIYAHHDTGNFAGGELWAYHNSFARGDSAINISSLLPGGYREGRILNNILNANNTVAHEAEANMLSADSFRSFNYNRIREISGNPPWYGSGNVLNASYEWGSGSTPPASMPNFEISSSSLAWNAGTNLSGLGLPDSYTKGPGQNDPWDIGAYELPLVIDESEPLAYRLTVNSGSGSGSYAAGMTVNLAANAPASGQQFDRWTGDVGNVANANGASTTVTMPAGNITVTAAYRATGGSSAGSGTMAFAPVDDACLQGTLRLNDSYLKVEAGKRVSYLKFNVSGLAGGVRKATLVLRESGDLGSGTLRVHRGSHNNWSESTLSVANAPGESGQVGTFSGNVGAAQVVSIDVTPLVTGAGIYSVVLKQDAGGNDIWFGSEESARKPQLIVETGGSASTPLAYRLTVNSGSGSGSYAAGMTVNLAANAPASGQQFDRWTGDVGNVANANGASTTVTMPAGNITVTAAYRATGGSSAGSGTMAFAPVDDACLQGTLRLNDSYLKVEAGKRVSYLKFNVSGLAGGVRKATLVLRESGDLGSGTLRVHRGSHNNWSESTLSVANAPGESGQVGTFSGNVGAAQVVSIDVTPLVTGAGIYSVVLKQDAGGNDIWFGSEESARKPQLIVETGGSAPAPLAYVPPLMGETGSDSEVAAAVPPQSPRLRLRRVGRGEIEIDWDGADGTIYRIQMSATVHDGGWTTLHSTDVSPGTLKLPVDAGATNLFFRLLRGD